MTSKGAVSTPRIYKKVQNMSTQSSKHTDSFTLSAELALSLADNGTEDQA